MRGKQYSKAGQSSIEFAFAMIIILLIAYGMVRVFRWVGIDMMERRIAHEDALINPKATNARKQLATKEFYRQKRIDAVYPNMVFQ